MAITPDQKAVLELLLGGQSYAELGDLLGLEEDAVRARARSGLEAIGGSDPDQAVTLSDYLLGQADPIGRADAVRHLRRDPGAHALAASILAELQSISPGADLPDLPPAPSGGRLRAAPATAPPRPPAARPSLADGLRARMRYVLGAGAVILVALVMAVAGVFSGDDEPADDASLDASASSATDDSSLQTDDDSQQERIALEAVGKGDASGEGIVGLTTGDQPYIDIVLSNLEPAPRGQVYVVWFLLDEKRGYPLSPVAPDNQGDYADRFAIPAPAISVAARMRFLNVSLAPIDEVQGAIQDAVDEQELVITKPGRTVLQNSQPLAAGRAGQNAE